MKKIFACMGLISALFLTQCGEVERKNLEYKLLKKGEVVNYEEPLFETGIKEHKGIKINYIKVDPSHYNFEIKSKKGGITYYDAKKENSVAFINGSFFDEEYNPIGLVISKGEIKNNVIGKGSKSRTKYWGIFSIDKENKTSIKYPSEFENKENINFAIQGYPVLVYNGKIKSKEEGEKTSRTAIGIDKDNNIVILSIRKNLFDKGIGLKSLGEIILKSEEEGGFECLNALNLDGGSSTQIYIEDKINKSSYKRLSNYILIKPIN